MMSIMNFQRRYLHILLQNFEKVARASYFMPFKVITKQELPEANHRARRSAQGKT